MYRQIVTAKHLHVQIRHTIEATFYWSFRFMTFDLQTQFQNNFTRIIYLK